MLWTVRAKGWPTEPLWALHFHDFSGWKTFFFLIWVTPFVTHQVFLENVSEVHQTSQFLCDCWETFSQPKQNYSEETKGAAWDNSTLSFQQDVLRVKCAFIPIPLQKANVKAFAALNVFFFPSSWDLGRREMKKGWCWNRSVWFWSRSGWMWPCQGTWSLIKGSHKSAQDPC